MKKNNNKGKKSYMNALLISLLGIFSVRGLFKGFVKSFFSLFAFLLALVLSFFVANYIKNVLVENKVFYGEIYNFICDKIINIDEELSANQFDSKEEMIKEIEDCNISEYKKFLLRAILEKVNFNKSMTISQALIFPVYSLIITLLCWLVLFVVLHVLIKIIEYYFLRLVSLKYFKMTDRTLGFLFGIIFAMIIYVVIIILLILLSHLMFSDYILTKINEGYLSSIIYNKYQQRILDLFYSLIS